MIRVPHPLFILGYVLTMAIVIVLSLMPAPTLPGPEGSDKAAHLLAYGAIAFCGGLGFRSWELRILSGSSALGLGVLLEIAQAAWFDRNGSVWDAASNSMGGVLGLLAAALILFMLKKQSRPAAS
jgi:VanZ family protein